MLSKKESIEFLLERDHLWDSNTKHEARLLCKAIFEKWPTARRKLGKVILTGPPQFPEEDEEDFKERSEHEIFNLLGFLEKEGLPLSKECKQHLEEIKQKYPQWILRDEFDVSFHGLRRTEQIFTTDDLLKKDQKDVIELLKRDQEPESLFSARREIAETIGLACVRNPNWCLQLFTELEDNINELYEDTVNPIFWGMESVDTKETWTPAYIKNLFSILELLIEVKPEGGFWSSLPRLFKKWVETLNLTPNVWRGLAERLWILFSTFDYERKEEPTRIEWIQSAINHPFGVLAELYLDVTEKRVADQSKSGKKFELDHEIITFFNYAIDNHNATGARYGLCILARALSWLEAILPDWTKENLIPLFYLGERDKQTTLVVWSGYLWNRILSRTLSQNFKLSYLNVAKFYNDLSDQDRNSLVVHIAGHAWFSLIDLSSLKEIIKLIDREGRQQLLSSWESHFEKAEENVVENFWQTIVLPYWEWCGQQGFLDLPDGDRERFGYWRLLPYSYAVFPKAEKKSIKYAPIKLEQVALFPKRIAESNLSNRFPDDFVDFLIAFIKADQNPHYHKDDWQQIWENVRHKGRKNLEELKNELARKGVINFS
jgi:hypothetical protein